MAMLASALCCGERDEGGCCLGQRPLNELWLTLEELVVFCIEDQRRSGNALRYTGQGVVLCFAEQVSIRARSHGPASVLQARAGTDVKVPVQSHQPVRAAIAALIDPAQKVREAPGSEGCVKIVEAVVEDERGHPVLVGGGAGDEEPAQAVAEKSDGFRIDLWTGEREVDHRAYYLIPVRPEHERLNSQSRSLSWPVESEDVVPAAQGGRPDGEVRFLQRGVVPAVVYDCRPGRARIIDKEQVSRQRR